MSQNSIKTDQEKVRFEDETVWMSLEDFQKGKIKGLLDVKNFRIEHDFNLSKQDDCKKLKNSKLMCSMERSLYEEDESLSSKRKFTNQHEMQKIQFKKIIDGLDSWDNDLKLKKRQEATKGQLFVSQDKTDFTKYNKQKEPELNMRLLNSIINNPEDNVNNKENKKNQNKNKENESTQNINNSYDQMSYSQNMVFPRSLNSIPNKPVTLISLKMKGIDDLKHKTVSRYFIDEDKKVIMKTDAQLHAEQNNQIINQIFKQKLSKITENEKPKNRNEYYSIVNNQLNLFNKDTLSKFKSLNHLTNAQEKGVIASNVRDPSHSKYGAIQYEKLYNELFEDKKLKKNAQLEQERQSLLSQTKYLDNKEKDLVISYQNHSSNCKSLKDNLNQQRVILNLSAQSNKSKLDEQKAVEDDFDKQLLALKKVNVKSFTKQKEEQQKNNQVLISVKSLNYQIENLQEKKKETLDNIQIQIDQINEEQKSIQKSVDQALKEYESAKERKNEIKFMLKKHYISNLNKEVTEKNNKSLFWTIMKLFSIKEEVTFNMFPEYLEEMSIEFLIQLARLEIQKSSKSEALKQLYSSEKMQKIKQNSIQGMLQMDINPEKKFSNISTISFSSSATFSQVSQQLKKPTFKLSQIFKPVVTYNPKNEKNQQQLEYQLDNQPQISLNDSIINKLPVDKQLKEIQLIEEQFNDLENEITQLKQKQFERLCLKHLKDTQDHKNIFYSLFGYFEGEKLNLEFERRKVKQDQIILANKTFQFSSVNGSQGHSIQQKSPKGCNYQHLNAMPQNRRSALYHSENGQQDNTLNSDNSNSFSSSKLSTQNSMRNTSYSLSQNDCKNIDSLPKSTLEQIKKNQVLLGIKKQSQIGEFKNSAQQINDKQDIFSIFSPKISNTLKKQHTENSLNDSDNFQNRIQIYYDSSLNNSQQLNNTGDKKHVSFNIKQIKKSQTNTQKQQSEQNLSLSLLFIQPSAEKGGFNALYSPINSSNSNISNYSQLNQSKLQQNVLPNQINKNQNTPKSVLRVSKFQENPSSII